MRKFAMFLLAITAAFALVGCNKSEDEVKEEEIEVVSLTVDEYYDIVLNTIQSEEVGTIKGFENQESMAIAGVSANYTGQIKSNISTIDVEYNYFDGTGNYSLEIDLLNPSEFEETREYPNAEVGTGNLETLKVMSLDKSTCEVNENIMTCVEENVQEDTSNGEIELLLNFSKTNYTFEFDKETFELISYSVDTVEFSDFYATTVEGSKTFSTSPDVAVTMSEEEYTEVVNGLTNYILNDNSIIADDSDSQNLLNYTIENYDIGFISSYYYSSEQVNYK